MVYIFLADGFEEIEAIAPIDILRRAGLALISVGVGKTDVTGAHGVTVAADITAEELPEPCGDIEAVILPGGGTGVANLEASAAVQSFIDYAARNNKLLGAICAAPSILAHRGLLDGKRAVCYPTFEKELPKAILSEESVTRDGNIITAKGAGVSIEFAFALAAALAGEEKAREIKEQMQCI